MKIKSWMTLAAGCVTLALVIMWTGCAAPEGPYVAVSRSRNPEASGKPVVLLNNDLMRTLAVDLAPMVHRNANNLLEIQVGLRNRTDTERVRIQVQTLFFDASGRVLYSQPGSEAAWQTLTLAPNQTTYYVQRSLTPEAARYLIRIRYVHKTR